MAGELEGGLTRLDRLATGDSPNPWREEMRLEGPIKYARLLKVFDAGEYGVKIETTRDGAGVETPGAEVVVILTVVNDVKAPRVFRHFVYWREKWWHETVWASIDRCWIFGLERIEEACPKVRRACEWAAENVRLG